MFFFESLRGNHVQSCFFVWEHWKAKKIMRTYLWRRLCRSSTATASLQLVRPEPLSSVRWDDQFDIYMSRSIHMDTFSVHINTIFYSLCMTQIFRDFPTAKNYNDCSLQQCFLKFMKARMVWSSSNLRSLQRPWTCERVRVYWRLSVRRHWRGESRMLCVRNLVSSLTAADPPNRRTSIIQATSSIGYLRIFPKRQPRICVSRKIYINVPCTSLFSLRACANFCTSGWSYYEKTFVSAYLFPISYFFACTFLFSFSRCSMRASYFLFSCSRCSMRACRYTLNGVTKRDMIWLESTYLASFIRKETSC